MDEGNPGDPNQDNHQGVLLGDQVDLLHNYLEIFGLLLLYLEVNLSMLELGLVRVPMGFQSRVGDQDSPLVEDHILDSIQVPGIPDDQGVHHCCREGNHWVAGELKEEHYLH